MLLYNEIIGYEGLFEMIGEKVNLRKKDFPGTSILYIVEQSFMRCERFSHLKTN